MRTQESRPRVVVGRYEYVDFPAWGIAGLRAKVDTGARTSALHVENVEELPHGRICFDVVRYRRKGSRRVRVEAAVRRRARVRSSSGHFTTRVFVLARIRLGPIEEEVEVSLIDRERMLFRMLIGRSFLAHRCLVDVGREAVHGRPRRRRRRRV